MKLGEEPVEKNSVRHEKSEKSDDQQDHMHLLLLVLVSRPWQLAAFFDPHLHAVLRPQRDQRLKSDLLFGHQVEFPFSRECCKQQDSLGPRERLAYTAADTAAEREVDVLLPRFFDRLRLPALGNKFVRVLPIARITLCNVRAHKNQCAFGNEVISKLMLSRSESPDRPRGWKQSHRLRKNRLGIF